MLKKGCGPAGKPGTPAPALCLLQILGCSSFSDFKKISMRSPAPRCYVATMLLSGSVLLVINLYSKGLYLTLKIRQDKTGSHLFVLLNR